MSWAETTSLYKAMALGYTDPVELQMRQSAIGVWLHVMLFCSLFICCCVSMSGKSSHIWSDSSKTIEDELYDHDWQRVVCCLQAYFS